MEDCLSQGESPVSIDRFEEDVPNEIPYTESWLAVAEAYVLYLDGGLTPAMRSTREHAETMGVRVEIRRLPTEPPLSYEPEPAPEIEPQETP